MSTKPLGAVSATEVDAEPCLVPTPELSHAETHYCGYNDSGIRIAVVMPFEDGYAIPGVYSGGGSAAYGGGLSLVKFQKLENAQRYCEMRNPCVSMDWVAEVVHQDAMNRTRR